MTEKQIVIHEVDEIVIAVFDGVIVLEQKTANGNEQQCIAFPVQYARQVIKAIKAAAK